MSWLRRNWGRIKADAARTSERLREELSEYECPPASPGDFVERPEYLGLGAETYPQVKRTFCEIVSGQCREAAIAWGIGSGKSYLASLLISYLVHRTLCLRDPQRHYGLAPRSVIGFMNMGPNADQARRVVFHEIRSRMRSSPWFATWCRGAKFLANEVRLPKNIVVVAGNSAETYPLGYNLLGAVIDEACWLPETGDGGRDAAEEIYHALQRRIKSRFGDDGLLVMISSLRHEEDFLQRKLREAERLTTVYGSRKAVWEVKPAERFSGESFEFRGLRVPVEYREEFERDPDRALRDLGSVATRARCAFFSDVEALGDCVDRERGDPMEANGELARWFQAGHSAGCYVHVDLGLKRDACGVAMAHCEAGDGSEPRVIVDYVERIEPPRGGEIEFERVRSRICELRDRGFRIHQVSFDGWQSVDSRQILARRGFAVKEVSVDRSGRAYETLRELVNQRRVTWPPCETLERELRALEWVRGTKVDHPPGGSKDVADAVAAAVTEALAAQGSSGIRGRVI